MNKNKTLATVLGVFALVIVTTGASFAFFQYQRTGNTKVNVTSGDIQFSYMEDNQNASLANAFPVPDTVGAVDITGEYEFTVNLTSSSASTIANYNVSLVSDNTETKNYFTNDQIKFALVKNNVYVAGTSSTKGLKLSEISGFIGISTNGEGVVLANQEIVSGQTDTYKLRIWISDDVSYNNTINTGVETGKYNGYAYSLKVKVSSSSNQITYGKGTDVIMNLATTQPGQIRVDNHETTGQQNFATTEYRYYGATPNNYVTFNNEPWRIIGAFDVDDGEGNIEKRLKIIRDQSIGYYTWDTTDASINGGFGINEWSQADVMKLLNNGLYYNSESGECYNGPSNGLTTCNFTSKGLKDSAKEMIQNAKWYLGANLNTNINSDSFYLGERSDALSKICQNGTIYCNDEVTRTHNWIGEIGLMYVSDYGYASDMNSCLDVNLQNYNSSCMNSNWLHQKSVQLTISPRSDKTRADFVFRITDSGSIEGAYANYSHTTRPVTYLKSSVKIISGTGTSTDPFILQ